MSALSPTRLFLAMSELALHYYETSGGWDAKRGWGSQRSLLFTLSSNLIT